MSKIYDVIIIGGGPAGLTSAIYVARAGKSVLILEKNIFGGQISTSPKVENYPAIPSASGSEIGDAMFTQALDQGAEAELEEVVLVEKRENILVVECESGAIYYCRSLIIASGAKPRELGIEKEDDFKGAGVCYCAVCDGAFFKGLDVAVAGGGNAALQDAILLSESCSKVYLVHRRDSFKGEKKLVETLKKKDNVEFVLNDYIVKLEGEQSLSGVVLNSGKKLEVDGLFVAIGHEPQNVPFKTLIDLDHSGYAASGENCMTRTEGVFVAGDCRAKQIRQLTTACADGSSAAIAACKYVNEH